MTRSAPPGPERVQVRLSRRTVEATDPCGAFLALRRQRGVDDVFLLESLAGPTADRRAAVVGFGPLLELEVRASVVELFGVPALVERARTALLASGTVEAGGDGLRLPSPAALWDAARALQNLFEVPGSSPDRWSFGFFAFFGYDTVRYVEKLPWHIPATDAGADLTLRVYHGAAVFDLQRGTAEVVVGASELWDELPVEDVTAAVASAMPADAAVPTVPAAVSVADSTDEARFVADVATCLGHIAVGDIYQVQIGHELTVRSPIDELSVYLRLRARNPSPYMCLVPLRGRTVVGASPELFVRIEGEEVVMRPIAGTARRSGDPVEDARRTAALQSDEKERAEHIMLVDLCRNDLGRIAQARSVVVDEMMVVEDFSHVFHLVSNVRARVREGLDAYAVVQATFPAGTMTGAPKIRAMEIIEENETRRRGLYAGAFGLMDFGGYVNLGLAIRTLFRSGDTWTTRASAGVVADSVPAAEWRETLAKMSATFWAVTGQELL